jgi:hypothetical protein
MPNMTGAFLWLAIDRDRYRYPPKSRSGMVPDQRPHDIDELFRKHIAAITPPGVRSEVRTLSGCKPAVVNPRHPAVQAASLAYRKAFGAAPVLLRSGGTIPIVSTFQEALGIPVVLMGFALPDDRIHGPNEKFHLPNFYNGIAASIWFLTTMNRTTRVGQAGQARKTSASPHNQLASALA